MRTCRINSLKRKKNKNKLFDEKLFFNRLLEKKPGYGSLINVLQKIVKDAKNELWGQYFWIKEDLYRAYELNHKVEINQGKN